MGPSSCPSIPSSSRSRIGWHHRLDGVFVHQIDDLQPWHRTTWHGLPISNPARCVVELGGNPAGSRWSGGSADDLIRLRKTTYLEIQRVFAEVARPGKPGMEHDGRVLDERATGMCPPQSELSGRSSRALAAGGLPAPRRQVPLPGRSSITGIADAAYDDARIVLEADGRRWHERVEQLGAIGRETLQVVRAGWEPLRFVFEQIVGSPAEVCAVVIETRRSGSTSSPEPPSSTASDPPPSVAQSQARR